VPLPTPLTAPSAAARRRPPGRIAALVLTAFVLAALATVTAHALALALLGAATVVLGTAAVTTLHAAWAAAAPVGPRPVPAPAAPPADGDSLTGELRRLHAAHLEKVNRALDEGRDDLARELADSYTDQALALLVRAS
jgi:hypothetical protein